MAGVGFRFFARGFRLLAGPENMCKYDRFFFNFNHRYCAVINVH